MTTFDYNDNDFLYVDALVKHNISCLSTMDTSSDKNKYYNEICMNKKLASTWQSLYHKHSGSNKRMDDTQQKNIFDYLIIINYIFSFFFFFLYIKNIV
jgi:hypothetical protein